MIFLASSILCSLFLNSRFRGILNNGKKKPSFASQRIGKENRSDVEGASHRVSKQKTGATTMGEESERGTKATGTDADTSQTADGETNDNAKKA